MHRCLNVLDIINLISENVYSDPIHGLKSTAALAATCQRFRDPALNILWRSLPDLLPLVRCLPPDAWIEEEKVDFHGDHERLLKISRPLEDRDFSRCRIYVQRIRHIGFSRINDSMWMAPMPTTLESTVYEAFEHYKLIPIIKLNSLLVQDRAQFPYFCNLLGPNIATLDFDFYVGVTSESNAPGAEVTCLPPTIRSMRFRTDFLPFEPSKFAHTLSKLSLLKVLHLPPYDLHNEVLRAIATSTSLEELRISFQSIQAETSVKFLAKKCPLQLRILEVDTANLKCCTEFMESFDTSYLQSIGITFLSLDLYIDLPTARQLEIFFRFLTKSCSFGILSKLKLLCPMTDEEPTFLDEFIINLATLRPLLFFRNLRNLYIFSDGGINLDDKSFFEMTKSWPKMRIFQLKGSIGWGPPDTYAVTPRGLVDIARYWTELEFIDICLSFNSSDHDFMLDSKNADVCCTTLMNLGVGDSPLEADSSLVATFLHNLFPNLSRIGKEDGDFSNPWENVDSLLMEWNNV